MLSIDGSYQEGGGAVLRVATALSAVTKKPCHVFNIRKNRSRPGLMPQHLLGIRALAQLCHASLEGDSLGGREIWFSPGEISGSRTPINVKIETAGSIALVLQTLIPAGLFASLPVEIAFDGGATDTFFSPSIDYFRYVFLKILKKMGGNVEINIIKKGYYPEGGAKVKVEVFPKIKNERLRYQSHGIINTNILKPLSLTERGKFQKILVISGASNALKNKKVAERQVTGVREILGKLKLPVEQIVEYYQTDCPGSQICLIAEFENTVIGVDGLGKLGKRAEEVGKEAALELLKEQKSQACFDKYLGDQMLIYMALAGQESKISVSELTTHTKTNIWTIEKFIDGKFEIKGNIIKWVPKKM